jgi:hypothetical protein
MRRLLPALALISSAGVVLCSEPSLSARSAAQQISQPLRGFGASITAAYEGWFNNADGTHNFLIGYYNRNEKQAADIPIGVNNRMEPGGPDMGQLLHRHDAEGIRRDAAILLVDHDQQRDDEHSVLDERAL